MIAQAIAHVNILDQAAAEVTRCRVREIVIGFLAADAHRQWQETGDETGFVRLAAYLESGDQHDPQ